MNELDLDKLLSMEDPLPEARRKPEPEFSTPPPPEPEPEETPRKKPKLTKPQRIEAGICLGILLVLGIAFGIWWKAQPRTTTPLAPVTTAPPATPALKSEVLREDSIAVYYVYQEPVPITGDAEQYRFSDGSTVYHLWGMPENIRHPDPSCYNLWLRVELTEKGKEKYTDPDMLWLQKYSGVMPVVETMRLGVTGYDTGSGELDGWFVFGCLTESSRITLSRQGTNVIQPVKVTIDVQPLLPMDASVLMTTYALAEQLLSDDTLWKRIEGSLPVDLSDHAQLSELSKRKDRVSILLEFYAHSSVTAQERIELLLSHPTFSESMTPEQLFLWQQGQQPRFSLVTFSQPLTEHAYTKDPLSSQLQHFFTDGSEQWHISPEIPTNLRYVDESEYNCYIRVTLSDYCRQSGYQGWNLRARGTDGGSAILGTREYYDDSGELAGWFVYGKIASDATVTFWLENLQGQTVQSDTLSVSPIQ